MKCEYSSPDKLEPSPYLNNMLLEGTSPEMMSAQSKLLFQINKYYNERVHSRKANINKTTREVCKVVQDVLKEVEVQEPRFIR